MAIAGVEAVENVNVKILEFDFASHSLIQVGTKHELPSEELYSREQVREILVMYSDEYEALNGQIDYPDIDEFMESDGE